MVPCNLTNKIIIIYWIRDKEHTEDYQGGYWQTTIRQIEHRILALPSSNNNLLLYKITLIQLYSNCFIIFIEQYIINIYTLGYEFLKPSIIQKRGIHKCPFYSLV